MKYLTIEKGDTVQVRFPSSSMEGIVLDKPHNRNQNTWMVLENESQNPVVIDSYNFIMLIKKGERDVPTS